MRLLAMLAQPFAMIADHNNDRIRISSSPFEESDQIPQCRIGIGNLAIIRILVFLRVRRRRLVRIMRVEQMNPNKSRAGAMLFEPTLSVLNNVHAATFDSSEALFTIGFRGEVVVEIEATVQSGGKR